MAINYESPYSGITDRTAATLESAGMVLAGVTTDGNGTPLRTTYSSIHDAVRASNILDTSTTFYVAKTGNDTTGDGTSGLPWLTITHALDIINSYAILPGVVPTIQVSDGVYTHTSTIDACHPATVITSENTLTRSITSVYATSGSSGAYTIVVNVDDVSGITTDDEIAISGATGGTNPEYLMGTWDVTNVDAVNTRITLASTHYSGVPAGLVTATLTVYKTVLSFTAVSGISASMTVSNLAIVGDGTASTDGVYAESFPVTLSNVSVRNFGQYGINCLDNGTILGSNIAISGSGGNGISCIRNGDVSLTSTILSGNLNTGALPIFNGVISLESCTISGNTLDGIEARSGGVVNLNIANITANGRYGIFVQRLGNVSTTSAIITGTSALFAQKYGYMRVAGATVTGTVSPAYNTQGNEFGYIDN